MPFVVLMLLISLLDPSVSNASAVTSANDLCSPEADPCRIDTVVETSRDYPLDFGGRGVVVGPEGKLVGTLDLHAGSFETTGVGAWMTVPSPVDSFAVKIRTTKECSLDSSLSCRSDSECASHSAGTCSLGSGDISLRGLLDAPSSDVIFLAAGDVETAAISVRGREQSYTAGLIFISASGSVVLTKRMSLRGGPGDDARSAAGKLEIFSGEDIVIERRILAVGGGADIYLRADRDLRLGASILASGRGVPAQGGGGINLRAGRDFTIANSGKKLIRIITSAAPDVPCGDPDVRSGGDTSFGGDRSTFVAENVRLRSDSTVADIDCDFGRAAIGGFVQVSSFGDVSFAGTVVARGRGLFGWPGTIMFYGADTVDFQPQSVVQSSGNEAGAVIIRSSGGGTVNMRGQFSVVGGGAGGTISVESGRVLDIDATIQGGGEFDGGRAFFNGCATTLQAGSRIDFSGGEQSDSPSSIQFSSGEQMTANTDSIVQGKPTSTIEIGYLPSGNLPILSGIMEPTPSIAVDGDIWPCP